MTLEPSASPRSAIIWACMSVAKPGNGLVITSVAPGAALGADADPVHPHVEPGAGRLELVQHRAEVGRHHVPDRDVTRP